MARVAASAGILLALLLAAGCGGRGATGPNVNLSRAFGNDGEVAAAVDPSNHDVLVAGSIGDGGSFMRVYSSLDGGGRWRSGSVAAAPQASVCVSDPAVGIGPGGTQYYAFLRVSACGDPDETSTLLIRSRSGPRGAWGPARTIPPAEPRPQNEQDRPVLAVDNGRRSPSRGRIWVAFVELRPQALDDELWLTHSDDRGRHWSHPALLGTWLYEPSLAVMPDGSLIVSSWNVSDKDISVMRVARDGTTNSVGFDAGVRPRGFWHCRNHKRRGKLRAMPHRCVGAAPAVAIDSAHRSIYVAWSGPARNGSRDVFVWKLDGRLRYAGGPFGTPPPLVRDGPVPADQFLATDAVDQRTGAVWVCFYDTHGDPSNRFARFTCEVSTDRGQSWHELQVARTPSDEAAAGADPFAYGDYESVVAAGGSAHAFWTDGRLLQEEIFTATLRRPH